MSNSIMILRPYKYNGQWVFDDPLTGLKREAFVGGTDTILDVVTAGIPNADKGFNLIFSGSPFPGFQYKLDWVREEFSGNTYHSPDLSLDGWLCPSLFKYFDEAPAHIYAKVTP